MNPISSTAYYCCGVREEDARREDSICHDVFAQRFMGDDGKRIFEPFRTELVANVMNIVRCRIIDDSLRAQVNAQRSVNVITIGAGFDSRPFRIENGRWVEIDEPAIIDCKNRLLPSSECKNSLRRIAIDFATDSLAAKLPAITGDVVVVIEGVFMYLHPAEVETTLKQLLQCYPGHLLICDLMNKRFFNKYGHRVHEKIAKLGTRFTARPEHPEVIFIEHGYAEIDHTSMFRRAHELGLTKNRLRMPRLVSMLFMDFLQRDLNAYAVYRFRAT